MREPGKLTLLNIRDDKDTELLADLLDRSYNSNVYKVLRRLFKDQFLKFLDAFQDDEFRVPDYQFISRRLEYLHIYRDSLRMSVSQLSQKYKRQESTIENIIRAIRSDLDKEDSDI